jgi:hypothetical protein
VPWLADEKGDPFRHFGSGQKDAPSWAALAKFFRRNTGLRRDTGKSTATINFGRSGCVY